jgi:hypothetical protein
MIFSVELRFIYKNRAKVEAYDPKAINEAEECYLKYVEGFPYVAEKIDIEKCRCFGSIDRMEGILFS